MTPAKPFGAVDISKIKPGDEVFLHCTVARFVEGAMGRLVVLDSGCLSGLEPAFDVARIVSHTPKALAVGDQVKLVETNLYDGRAGVVSALEGTDAWVRFPDGSHCTVDRIQLERVDV